MVVIAIPILTSQQSKMGGEGAVSDRTEYYATAKNLLSSGADAMERLMTAYKVTKSPHLETTIFFSCHEANI